MTGVREASEALPAAGMEQLLGNRRAVPYRDPYLSRDRDTILRERSDEIKGLRSVNKT